ncbi:uncharacterized protein LOC112515654 [Cynara cardunculus var. scolymus]|uniref:uncharacterized protein LOC112515654 n=1 Tax=Cynara cardunculus var. scolymus TaxID=59895 RepID=UPI000D625907|nr:uncharacterized protein LOC112515654 [Cynara cardunculus var. scolymus]
MGAKVQSKTHFPGSMMDLNNGFCNGVWDLYHDDKSRMISGPGNSQHFDYFLTRQATDGYAKEQIRQTILKHESIFRHQLQELHRLYKRQRDLMNPVLPETSNLGRFPSQASSSFSLVGSAFSRASTSKCDVSERKVIDLELPADVEEKVGNFHSLSTEKVFNLADLNEPIQIEETDFSASVRNKNSIDCFADEPQKRDSAAKRTIFGVEICGRNHTPSFDFLRAPTFRSSNPQSSSINPEPSLVLPWRNTTSLGQNGTILHHNHWLGSGSSDSMRQNPSSFAGNLSSRLMTNSRPVGFLNGIKSKDPVSDNLEEICVSEKRKFMDMWKNRETPAQRLSSWLVAKPCLQSEEMNGKETSVYPINLDSLQNHSQQFFKKAEMAEGNDPREFKKVKTDDSQSFSKILGVPIIDLQNSEDLVTKETDYDPKVEDNGGKNCISDIDLNLSLDEEDAPFLGSVVKIATMEIDLEAPAVLESETNSPEMDSENGSMDDHFELDKAAAEAIVSISSSKVRDSCHPPQEPSAATLMWFAVVITSDGFKKSSIKMDQESIPEGMDDFEFMTLKLRDSDESYENYKPTIVEEEKEKEEETGSFSKRTPRKGQGRRGRQRKDFQKDILPNIITLSRREVTEDLQTFEEAFSSIGVSWQSSLSKRKAAARNGRSRRQLMAVDTSSKLPPPPPGAVVVEQTVCREVALEKSLGGWGRRTRRLPRQRCGNAGNHHSFALKC